MSSDASAVLQKISARFEALGISVGAAEIQQLTDYFCLLAKWNDRINLTSLPVAEAATSAIDRLLVEPIVGSRLAFPTDRLAVDLGSGGGSPAFPLRIGAPQLRMVLVESRERKCAFLREVSRSLGFSDVEVANVRFETLQARKDLAGQADLVTFRAVRADGSLWTAITALLRPGGRALWFGGDADLSASASETQAGLVGMDFVSSQLLTPATGEREPSSLTVLRKSS